MFPEYLNWNKETRKEILNLLDKYKENPVSACLTFRGILKNKDKSLSSEQYSWLQKAVVESEPLALAMLHRDFKACISTSDFRVASIAKVVSETVKSGSFTEEEKADLNTLKKKIFSGTKILNPIWKITRPQGTFLHEPYA
ncbi:MAG: hypothetical protein NT106_09200 [Candidatus Sumerlaeota bacterium]|nr:hypothetical protein [Candidatus Sumerlaeota bacterium]